jgi:hypothetical protein
VIENFDDAQRRAIRMLDDVIGAVEPRMTARDIAAVATERRDAHGFDRWFHHPVIDVGCTSGRFRGLAPPARVEAGMLVTVDLGPADARAFGDVGVTFSFGGGNEPEIVSRGRELVRATAGYASPKKTVGELYVYARAWANNRQLRLADETGGHACLGPDRWCAVGWARSAMVATWMRRHRLWMLNPARIRGAWALRLPVTDGTHTVVFEEMIAVDDAARRVLGRGGVEEVGAFASLGVAPAAPIGPKGA